MRIMNDSNCFGTKEGLKMQSIVAWEIRSLPNSMVRRGWLEMRQLFRP